MRQISYVTAMNEALTEEMDRDDRVYLIGLSASADTIGTHKGLYEKFGAERVKDAILSEPGIVGSCVGAALAGLRPIFNSRGVDFLIPAADETFQRRPSGASFTGESRPSPWSSWRG